MHIALYQGKSTVSEMIRFITRSKYSHAAFVFDKAAQEAASRLKHHRDNATKLLMDKLHYYHFGAVVEAWQGGVKNSAGLSTLHTPGTVVDIFELVTPMTEVAEERLVRFCADIIGWPYGYMNVLRFITKQPGSQDGSYFCSEAVFEGFRKCGQTLLKSVQDWEVPPAWLAMSTELRLTKTIWTR